MVLSVEHENLFGSDDSGALFTASLHGLPQTGLERIALIRQRLQDKYLGYVPVAPEDLATWSQRHGIPDWIWNSAWPNGPHQYQAIIPPWAQQLERVRPFQRGKVILAAMGCTNEQIAQLFHIEKGTAKFEMHQIFQALGVKSRRELWMYEWVPQAFTSPQSPCPLEPQERLHLSLFLQAKSEKEIAAALDLTPNTVKHYRSSLMLPKINQWIDRCFGVSAEELSSGQRYMIAMANG